MNNRSYCSRFPSWGRCARQLAAVLGIAVWAAGTTARAGGEAPGWMHALTSVALPTHDEKTEAVLLYSENVLVVQPSGKLKEIERRAYRILRPEGKKYGAVRVYFDSESKIGGMRGWCIPAQGKDYEVKEKESVETSLTDVENGILMSDNRVKILMLPAADPGNIIGYEIEREDRPYVFEDEWMFQETVPVREARYTLQLPAGWEYKASWMSYPAVQPVSVGNNQWQWTVSDIKAVKPEGDMPPWSSVAGQMFIALLPPGAGKKGFTSWQEMGQWERELASGRAAATPAIKEKAAALTAGIATPLGKMRALAEFVQREIRYVGIELGIGGWQPHAAGDVFSKRYGDCKDKAVLMSALLGEAGLESYPVIINTQRGVARPGTPAHRGAFNHMVLAIKLPEGIEDRSLVATVKHARLGRLLFFDPTNELIPLGRLGGHLQGNYGLLVTAEGGELVELPTLATGEDGIERTGKFSLDAQGTLSGDVHEIRRGDEASAHRYALRSVSSDSDRIKPIESMLAYSLATFRITKATVANAELRDLPFVYDYSLVSQGYGKAAGNLLLVRPRVLGNKASALLETKEPRRYAIEFDGPTLQTDTFEITLPAGYEVDELPPAVKLDNGYARYESKTEAAGKTLRYTRTFEVKELSVPVEKAADLKLFYRKIASDERNVAVLRPAGAY
ncbi:MAG: DUF3857 and transglutaminase domain-containing protein [Acidobacteriia bacterium]|nr:DUF3857 and transglutaminase domain-containing protein [Terriglobia bacterium]